MDERCAECPRLLEPGRRVRGRCRTCYQRAYMYARRAAHRPVPRSRQDWPCAACGETTRPHTGRAHGMCKRCHDRSYSRARRAALGR